MQFIPGRSKRVRSYLDLTIKFHDYSRFFTALDVAILSRLKIGNSEMYDSSSPNFLVGVMKNICFKN